MKKIFTIGVMLCLVFAMLLPVGAFASHEPWPTLSEELKNEIEKAYAVKYIQDEAAVTELRVTCVGEYDGMYFCKISDFWNFDPNEREEYTFVTVGGLTFNKPGYRRIVIYSHGEILKLSEAWDAGWLSEAVLKQMHYDYYNGGPEVLPCTGDTTQILLVIAMLLSGSALAFLVLRKKKTF